MTQSDKKMKIRNNNGSLSRGQKGKFPAMALGLSLAMTAPTWGALFDSGPGGPDFNKAGITVRNTAEFAPST